MKRTLIGQILLLSVISHTSSSLDNLDCYTDYMEVITCVWNTSSAEDRFHVKPTTSCFLESKYDDGRSKQTNTSNLEPLGSSQPKLRKGTVTFKDKPLNKGDPFASLKVMCENVPTPLESTQRFRLGKHIKLYPPEKSLVKGANITWQCCSPQPKFVKVKYEVQWGLLENDWENNQVASTEEQYCELPEEKLILGKQYVVRVRSTPSNKEGLWSDWSPVTQWTATVGVQPPTEEIATNMILGQFTNFTTIVMVPFALIVAAVCILRHRKILKCQYVPTPGKYFADLFSDHGGDFKSWLGPIVNPEIFIKADSECISPVTICKARSSEMLPNKLEKDVNTSEDDIHNFSNSTYFLSQSSKCAILDQLEPCAADCPYGPAGGGSVTENFLPATHDNGHDIELTEVNMRTPLETSSSYKQLQKLRLDIQSPDSGFAGSSEEQESQEESGSEGLPSPPVVDNTLPSCLLPCPMPQLVGFPHLGIPSSLAWSPWNNRTFTNLNPDITGNVLMGNCSIMACSGVLEPSSDDYMPVKNVQG